MYNRCIVFKGASRYDALSCFADEICGALGELGCEAVVFELSGEKPLKDLVDLIESGIDFAFSFNAMGIDIMYGDMSIYDYMKLPFIGFMVDAPIHHHERLSEKVENAAFTFVDRGHVSDFEARFPGKRGVFLPHGGSISKNPASMEERTADVLFCGSYSNIARETQKELEQMNSPVITNLYNKLLNSMLKDAGVSYRAALKKSLKITPDANMFEELLPLLVKAETAYRSICRENILTALLAAGVKVTCVGHGWNNSPLTKYDNFIHEPSIGFFDAIELMGKSKICLNCSPMFKNGSHERVFSAMLCGAVCLSDENIYLKELFANGEDILFYNVNRLKLLPDIVLSVLEDNNKLKSISERAYEKAVNSHTWKNRASDILRLVNNCFYQQ